MEEHAGESGVQLSVDAEMEAYSDQAAISVIANIEMCNWECQTEITRFFKKNLFSKIRLKAYAAWCGTC